MAKTPKTDSVDAPVADAPAVDNTTPAADVIADLGNATLSPEAAEALAKVAPPAAAVPASEAAAVPASEAAAVPASEAAVTVSRIGEKAVPKRDDKNAVDKSAITAQAVVKTPDGFTVRNR